MIDDCTVEETFDRYSLLELRELLLSVLFVMIDLRLLAVEMLLTTDAEERRLSVSREAEVSYCCPGDE